MISEIIKLYIQLFFLFTPFFALSMFLTLTEEMSHKEQLILIAKTMLSTFIICIILIFGGNAIFKIFGITVDAFRIGAGIILFLSAIDLVQGRGATSKKTDAHDLAVVPLSIPIIVGPATIGTLLIMGSELSKPKEMLAFFIAIIIAILSLSIILAASPWILKVIGKKGIAILSRLTGLILAALASQMVFTGIKSFFNI